MSKKLIYDGIEVTPNDPRLPEILASIVELVQKSMGKQLRYRYQHINGEQIFAFLDEDTIHINKDGMSVADCLKQPGFKVVDDKGD